MNDLLKKLNVLVKAGLNDLVSGEERHDRSRPRLGKNVEAEIAALRQRINEAVQYEDTIVARIRGFEDEAARWDREADAAVTRGDEAAARAAVEQMQRAQQRAAMTQGDLREHQQVTQELIQRVNTLDAVVADARRAEAESAPPAEVEAPPAAEAAKPAAAQLPDLGNVLREAREKIAALADTAATQNELTPPAPADDAAVDDDLDRRRQRLSKR